MKLKITIEELAAKQLESAIWMYAYEFDEAAVHTVAGAAFELYTKRLGLGTWRQQAKHYVRPGMEGKFWAVVNKPYNFFKHGEHNHKALAYIEYDPEAVEFILMAASEANLMGDEKYRLATARKFRLFFMLKNPDLIKNDYPLDANFEKLIAMSKDIRWNQKALKHVLNNLPSPVSD